MEIDTIEFFDKKPDFVSVTMSLEEAALVASLVAKNLSGVAADIYYPLVETVFEPHWKMGLDEVIALLESKKQN